jgi:hypothetical protein
MAISSAWLLIAVIALPFVGSCLAVLFRTGPISCKTLCCAANAQLSNPRSGHLESHIARLGSSLNQYCTLGLENSFAAPSAKRGHGVVGLLILAAPAFRIPSAYRVTSSGRYRGVEMRRVGSICRRRFIIFVPSPVTQLVHGTCSFPVYDRVDLSLTHCCPANASYGKIGDLSATRRFGPSAYGGMD